MSTAVLGRFESTPSSHLRITRRGRAVLAAVVAVPIAVAVGSFVLGSGSAVATGGDSPATFEYVQVEAGQSLWEIAATVAPDADPRDVVSDIVHLNRLTVSDVQPGQELAIPAQYSR